MAKAKKSVKRKVRDIHYTQYVPVKVDAQGDIQYCVSDDFAAIGASGCSVGEKYRTRDIKNAKFFWSPNDAKAFCTLATGDGWVVLKRTIEYTQV